MPRCGATTRTRSIYEVHVKGFTMCHPDVPESLRDTYAGLAHEAVLGYLTDLGVTAVELLPVHQYVPDDFLLRRGLTNYWGYNTIGYFAPHAAYSAAVHAGDHDGGQVAEFKTMVRAMHRAGLEVILDVVFNHTAEGLTGIEAAELGWFTPAGTPMTQECWDDGDALALGVYLDGSDAPDTGPDSQPLLDDDFLVLVNAWWEPLEFTIGNGRRGLEWIAEIDSFDPASVGSADAPQRQASDRVTVGPRSVLVLRGPRAARTAG